MEGRIPKLKKEGKMSALKRISALVVWYAVFRMWAELYRARRRLGEGTAEAHAIAWRRSRA